MQYADNRELRRQLYVAYNSRGFKRNNNNNEDIIHKIVNLRLEEANLLGFKNYAEYVLDQRMAKNPAKVEDFLNELHQASRPFAEKEYKEVEEFAKSTGFRDKLQKWDWSYYSEKLKNARYEFDEQQVKPYFQLEKVRGGIFELTNRLNGLTYKENKEIPV